MKQEITQEQWEELDNRTQLTIWKKLGLVNNTLDESNRLRLSIGDMIEYIGRDLRIFYDGSLRAWFAETSYCKYNDNELADALWKAVKHKLEKQ